jgi:ribosomal protein L37AE/L43A
MCRNVTATATESPRRSVRPKCPTCRARMFRWAWGEWVCATCTVMAPLPPAERPIGAAGLRILKATARWPGVG